MRKIKIFTSESGVKTGKYMEKACSFLCRKNNQEKTFSISRECAKCFFLLIFSGLFPETHSLFAKREAKILIRSV
jgi:hypothetical protein